MITELRISNWKVDWEIYNGEIRPTDLWTYRSILVALKLEPLDTVCLLIWYHMKHVRSILNQNWIKLPGPTFIFRKYRGQRNEVMTPQEQKTNVDFWIFFRPSESFSSKSMALKKEEEETKQEEGNGTTTLKKAYEPNMICGSCLDPD